MFSAFLPALSSTLLHRRFDSVFALATPLVDQTCLFSIWSAPEVFFRDLN